MNKKDSKSIGDSKTSAKSPPMIKQMPSPRRSCLKHQSTRRSENGEAGRVSFATANDGRVFFISQTPTDVLEKKSRSDIFAKKAKELQLAELTYFKDHAGEKESPEE